MRGLHNAGQQAQILVDAQTWHHCHQCSSAKRSGQDGQGGNTCAHLFGSAKIKSCRCSFTQEEHKNMSRVENKMKPKCLWPTNMCWFWSNARSSAEQLTRSFTGWSGEALVEEAAAADCTGCFGFVSSCWKSSTILEQDSKVSCFASPLNKS